MRSGKLVFISLALALIASSCWDAASKPGDRSMNESRNSLPDSKVSNSRANNGNSDSGNQMTTISRKTGFMANVPSDFSEPSDEAGRTLFKEYGAVFVAKVGVIPPKTVVFKDSAEVSSFRQFLANQLF